MPGVFKMSTQDDFYGLTIGQKIWHVKTLSEYEFIRPRNDHWFYLARFDGDCSKLLHVNSVIFVNDFRLSYNAAVQAELDQLAKAVTTFNTVYGDILK